MWYDSTYRPEIGRRIIAIFDDGSGGCCFLATPDGLVEADNPNEPVEYDDFADKYFKWTYLPDGLLLFFEQQEACDNLPQ